jgi:hypothetical protein
MPKSFWTRLGIAVAVTSAGGTVLIYGVQNRQNAERMLAWSDIKSFAKYGWLTETSSLLDKYGPPPSESRDSILREASSAVLTRPERPQSLAEAEVVMSGPYSNELRISRAFPDQLEFAASHGNARLVRLLIKNGWNPDGKNRQGSPLVEGAKTGNVEVIQALIDAGADVNRCSDVSGDTALQASSRWNHENITRLLLSRKANPNIVSSSGETALDVVTRLRLKQMAQLLRSAGENESPS